MKKFCCKNRGFRSGFSLLEVLFTVLILAVLAAVAIPLYSNTKTSSEASACKSNVQAIANAESKYKFDNGSYSTATASADLLNEGLGVWPACPHSGATYSVATSGNGIKISCSYHNGTGGTTDNSVTFTQ